MSATGLPNLAPFSFFMAGGGSPLSVTISPLLNRAGLPKDTLTNISENGEYVINAVSFEMASRMNVASADYPPDVSEWDRSGLTPAPSVRVGPARVAESPFALECRLFTIVSHGSGFLAANYIIGEIVAIHVAARLYDGDRIVPQRAELIARMGGDWYARADAASMFEMARPAPAPARSEAGGESRTTA
ncbi:MAG: flavin reductase family protein [Armatimonadetes bacterium]|nr:flavin reductase family protein [Armatimonadota bacterium]MDE2206405.1 flavin reductase family protein [Armatimonadota bacterium]